MRGHDCGPGQLPGPAVCELLVTCAREVSARDYQWWLIPSGRPLVSLASSTPTAEITQRIMM